MSNRFVLLLIALFTVSFIAVIFDKPVITNGDFVVINYSAVAGNMTFKESTVNFTVGAGQVLTGLEVGVLGMRAGQVKNLILPPSLAYGDYNPDLVFSVPVSFFNEHNHSLPVIGEKVTLNGAEGFVINLTDEEVIIDTNNPLSGLIFNFTIKVLKVVKS